jgi:hypothetical protein
MRVELAESAREAFEPVQRFFRHGILTAGAASPAFVVNVAQRECYGPLPEGGEPVTIRRSSAAAFNFQATRALIDGRWRYDNLHTAIDAPRTCSGNGELIGLGISDGSCVQVIDFLRELAMMHEERNGTVVLHAAGVLDDDGGVVAIAGAKGAGKTTTLLQAVINGEMRYFSGDKILCRLEDGQILCNPWRDWPYVGAGTLRSIPQLADRVSAELDVPLERLADTDKLLLDPDLFESWIGAQFEQEERPLHTIVLPNLAHGQRTEAKRIEDLSERWVRLNKVVERTADTSFFGWQSFYEPDYESYFAELGRMRPALTRIGVFEIRGWLDVPLSAFIVS